MMNKLNILYEDNHIIVVEKPRNILSQSDITKDLDLLTIVKQYIKEKYHKPGKVYLGLVHRLDRPVGGVMVFAKTSKAAARLSDQIKNHKIEKKYLAIVHGKLSPKGTFIDKLEKLSNGTTIISDKGKESELSYKVKKYRKKENLSLVEISLKSGRHHQIRVQFSSRGHALYGDQKYGQQEKENIALFAYYLKFYHPTTKKLMQFKISLSQDGYWTKFTQKKNR